MNLINRSENNQTPESNKSYNKNNNRKRRNSASFVDHLYKSPTEVIHKKYLRRSSSIIDKKNSLNKSYLKLKEKQFDNE